MAVVNPTKTKGEEFGQGAMGDRGKDFGKEAMEKGKDFASSVAEGAKSAASSVMHSAENAASYAGKKADEGVAAVGSNIKSWGDSVRHAAPQQDMLKGAAETVAGSLESTGRYLEEHGLTGMAEDLTNVIKRNPIPALLIAVGIGFLLARACTPSRSA